MTKTWQSKNDKREAAVAFLQKTITDPAMRRAVLKDRQAAREWLQRAGDLDLPDDVEVICVGPSTQERDRVVVFVLPPETTDPAHIDAFKYWIGPWFPYDLDPAQLRCAAKDSLGQSSLK
jgi:hypothetical protein